LYSPHIDFISYEVHYVGLIELQIISILREITSMEPGIIVAAVLPHGKYFFIVVSNPSSIL
jgi:hypothetical protein